MDRVLASRRLPDGRLLELWPMAFGNTRFTITEPGDEGMFFADAYCYQLTALAMAVIETWDGEGHPFGYYRHVGTDHRQSEYMRSDRLSA